MRLLVDTQIVYWWYYQTARLQPATVDLIREAEVVFISSVSLWEIAIKARLGKIKADPKAMVDWIQRSDFQPLVVDFRHAIGVTSFPMHHKDPFDRILVAQAQAEGLRLLTTDGALKQYGEFVLEV